jgi:hypothetical protein
MVGKDRVPDGKAAPTSVAHDMLGGQFTLGYNLNYRNQICLKYEQFDPNRQAAGDMVRGYGISYVHYLNPFAKLILCQETLYDEAKVVRERRNDVSTIRLQFKF